MPFTISGYVLEPCRTGQSNATFTQSPDNYVADPDAFGAAYPSDESAPRTDYLVLLTSEGTPHPGLLECARFGFTKNEVVTRFGYDAQAGAFRPLRGAKPVEVGVLSEASNGDTTRLRVMPPVQSVQVGHAPYRLSVGGTGSGTTWPIAIVATDDEFGDPPTKTAELSFKTGNLNWHSADLLEFVGQPVRFQQQQYYEYKDSTGNLGMAPIETTDPPLLLNPLPGPGQFPRLRFGYGLYLVVEEVASESDFNPQPPSGTVQWASDTGRLKFNPEDAQQHAGVSVYYDGVLFADALSLPSQPLGKIHAPHAIIGLPPAGADLIFTLPDSDPYYRFRTVTYRAKQSFTSGKTGEVQVDPTTGEVQFSATDRNKFPGQDVILYFGDLPIERGISVRFLRNPVNLDAALALKDVTALYTVKGATWADPVIQSPQVSLPSLPIQDPAYRLVVQVLQGQGHYVNDDFPDFNKPSPPPGWPPPGLGYYIDFDGAALFFAERKNELLIPIETVTSDIVLPDPLLLSSNLKLELVGGVPDPKPLTIGKDVLVDTTAGVVSLASTNAQILQGSGAVSGHTLTDPTASFVTAGVQPRHVVVLAGIDVYTVASVSSETTLELDQAVATPSPSVTYSIYESQEVLADRYFDEVVLVDPSTKVERIRKLGVASNDDRLSVPIAYVESSGFRLGSSQSQGFATVVLLPDDVFGTPPTGTVEISKATGNLNFASADLGAVVYWSRELVPKVDYVLQPELGLVQFTERMLADEEARVTYKIAPPSTLPPTLPGPPTTEYATFLIRKELTKHDVPTSTIAFNVAGRPVAVEPPPAVFRGGRPQKLGVQCTVDAVNSQITFLSDSQLTDALPHGATVNPSERVYIDYYVKRAVGGEKTFTVLHPPILTSVVEIRELTQAGTGNDRFELPGVQTAVVQIPELTEVGTGNDRFEVSGDQTARFPHDHLMRIETEQIYLIASATYDAASNKTTVVVTQPFQDSFSDPQIYVSSGPTPIAVAALVPPYFVYELVPFEAIPRGNNTFLLPGDQSLLYRTSTVVLFTDGASSFTDFLQVTGASYDPATDRTSVMLLGTTPRQYVSEPGQQILLRSVRPIFEPPVTGLQTNRVPKLTQPHLVYRRITGKPGKVLVSPTEYTIDDSGHVVFEQALGPLEEFAILYTGLTTVNPGLSLQASYTCQVAPSVENGLLGQTLLADYTISSPDTFYFRVESMTNFRGEYAVEIATTASSGSSGPQTSNISQPELFEQGRKSLYFDQRHLANQDIVARSSLRFYNDVVSLLEDYRRTIDGRVVGNNDGPFLFNEDTNQIDDIIKVSDAPYKTLYRSWPPPHFSVQSIGTYRPHYLPSPLSRFYPTAKNFFAISAVIEGVTRRRDEVVDTTATNITQMEALYTRLAWAVVTEPAPKGASVIRVDFTGIESDFSEQATLYARPSFKQYMECVIQTRNGTFVNDASSPIKITSMANNQLNVSNLAGDVNVGDTVYRSPIDTSLGAESDQLISYVLTRDYSFNPESGQLTYLEPSPGTPLVPGQALSGKVQFNNSLTAPLKFPALFGGIEDDDGDLSFPIQSLDPVNESGYLAEEATSTGAIRARTTPPLVSNGTLEPDRVTIIDPSIVAMAPLPHKPKAGTPVRILSGVNANTAFRVVVSVDFTIGSLVVKPPFDAEDSNGFSYELAVSPVLASGFASDGTQSKLIQNSGQFLSKVRVGHTVIFDAGFANSSRHQVCKVVSNTEIWFMPPSQYIARGRGYAIENSLATFGLPSSTPPIEITDPDYLQRWKDALTGELPLYPLEQTQLLAAIDLAFTDVTEGTSGQVEAGQVVFEDPNARFKDDGVLFGHCVYITSGSDAGVYEIIEPVESQTQVTVGTKFPATAGSISYRVVSRFGLTVESIQALFEESQAVESLGAPVEALLAKLEPVAVLGLNGTPFATSLLGADLDSRDSAVQARLAALPESVQLVEDILAGTERLYDQRYVWIDTRINLEDGLLVRQTVAAKNQIKTQAETLKQLTKLLAVGGA